MRNTLLLILCCVLGIILQGCKPRNPVASNVNAGKETEPRANPGALSIPSTVRQNLGVTFASVSYRAVSESLRVPGKFQSTSDATRSYTAPLAGRVRPLVTLNQPVVTNQPLFELDSPAWDQLLASIGGLEAKLKSMGPLREAHRVHEKSLSDKVTLWKERITVLESLRSAGGGSAAEMTQARAALNETQAELADVMEKDAQLAAEEVQATADVTAAVARKNSVLRMARAHPPAPGQPIVLTAAADGVVVSLDIHEGAIVTESTPLAQTLDPAKIKFTLSALQADLHRLTPGSNVTVEQAARARALSGAAPSSLHGILARAPFADADTRTVDIDVQLTSGESGYPAWAIQGVWAFAFVSSQAAKEELAIPRSAVVRDGLESVIFKRNPKNNDEAIRIVADLGFDDGTYVIVKSGLREGDQVVVGGAYQLMLASSGSSNKGGHFHSDGTFHEGED